jgi:hypothetical protein
VNAKVVTLFVVIAALLWSFAVEAEPIGVRLIEGNYRGFLVVRSTAGAAIAYGEMSQKPTSRLVESRMILKFKDGSLYDEPKPAEGTFEMPDDLYNGMALILLKNLPGGAGATVHLAVFTPEPRLIEMEWSWEGEDEVLLGGRSMKTKRSLVKLKIGGLAGVIASLVGRSPPDLRYWLVTGDVPAFVRFEGAMFLNGPVWRVEMTALEWPK